MSLVSLKYVRRGYPPKNKCHKCRNMLKNNKKLTYLVNMLKKHIYVERIYVFLYQNLFIEYYNNIPITV